MQNANMAPGHDHMTDLFPRYSRRERTADAAVHAAGIGFVTLGGTFLIALAWPGDIGRLVAISFYVFGLAAGIGCSALYNLVAAPRAKERLRRLDHAAIYVMIAGTYTPFATLAIGGTWGKILLVLVWTGAVLGVAVKLALPRRFDRASMVAYLLLGWSILPAIGPLVAALSVTGLVLLFSGGALYSLGVLFHLAARLPYQNAIWHAMVLAAAICHYLAVLGDLAVPP